MKVNNEINLEKLLQFERAHKTRIMGLTKRSRSILLDAADQYDQLGCHYIAKRARFDAEKYGSSDQVMQIGFSDGNNG